MAWPLGCAVRAARSEPIPSVRSLLRALRVAAGSSARGRHSHLSHLGLLAESASPALWSELGERRRELILGVQLGVPPQGCVLPWGSSERQPPASPRPGGPRCPLCPLHSAAPSTHLGTYFFFFLPCRLTPSSAEPAACDPRAAGSGEARGRLLSSSPLAHTHAQGSRSPQEGG